MGTKAFFDCNTAVIKNDAIRYAANDIESPDDRVAEAFLILTMVGQYNRSAAEAQPCTEKIDALFSSFAFMSSSSLTLI